jgi:HSP20 family protein
MGSNPFKEIERLLDRMGRSGDWPTEMLRDVPIDVADHGDRFEVTVDVPGFDRDAIDLMLSGQTLRISAERELEREERETDEEEAPGGAVRTAGEGVTYVRKERRRKSIERSVELPEAVDEGAVEATLANGVLTVTLPKLGAADEARQIDIE